MHLFYILLLAPSAAEHADRGELTYVHCKAGRGRSTTLVMCYLIKRQRMAPGAALALIRGTRPQVHLAQVRCRTGAGSGREIRA